MRVTTRRKRSKAAPPITGVATGSLGTAANLDDTQVLRAQDLDASAPAWLDHDAEAAAAPAAAAPRAQGPPTEHSVAPVQPSPQGPSVRQRQDPLKRRRGMALAGAGALATLLVLAGAGILSQLDLGASGAEPTFPAFGITTAPPVAETPEPQDTGGKGHGHDTCHGKHCN